MPAAKSPSFVDGLLQSQLLDAEQSEELRRLSASMPDTRALAQELLRREWLTAYQVNQIFQGNARDLILGPFILLERIGEGGMGQVFKAKQKLLNRTIALKVIRKECVNNPRVILRFQREIRAAGQLNHPHIVRAYDADQVNGTYYIAMEYIDGVDLAKLVRDSGPLPVDQACDYIRQAALGLQHASERGLVHRDIKPANLLVSRAVGSDRRISGTHRRPDVEAKKNSSVILRMELERYPFGVVKILDMGLARLTDSVSNRAATHLTQIGAVMGTPEYIAPEQARDSRNSDVRADLYSLGCTMYFLLAGMPPFPQGTLTEKLLHHQLDEPTPLLHVRHEQLLGRLGVSAPASLDKSRLHVPKRVEEVLHKLMAKRPEDRYQTPNELAFELQAILRQLADGSLLVKEAAEETKSMVVMPTIPDPVEGTDDGATILLAPTFTTPETTKRRESHLVAKLAVGIAACTSFFLVLLVTCVAVLMSRNTLMRAGHAPPEPPPRIKETDEPTWKKLVRSAIAKHVSWDEARLEIQRQRQAAPDAAHAKRFDDLLTRMPSPLDKLERAKFPGMWPAQLPADFVGMYGFVKGNFSKSVTTLAVSSNGRWIVTNEDNGVRLFDVQSDSVIPHKILAHADRVNRVAISPDGRLLATAGDDGLVRIWDLATRSRLLSLDKHKRPVTQLAFNHDGTSLASAGRDGMVRLWDPRSGAEQGTFDTQSADIGALAFAADDKTLFWCADSSLKWADARNPKAAIVGNFDSKIAGLRLLAFQPHGNLAIVGNGQASLAVLEWDGKAVTEKSTLKDHLQIHQIAFACDGKTFVSAGSEPSATLWDASSLTAIKSWRNPRGVGHSVAFSPDNRHFALGSANNQVYVIRLAVHDMDALRKSLE